MVTGGGGGGGGGRKNMHVTVVSFNNFNPSKQCDSNNLTPSTMGMESTLEILSAERCIIAISKRVSHFTTRPTFPNLKNP